MLRDRDIEPTIRDYVGEAPKAEEVRGLLDLLDVPPLALVRTKERAFADAGLTAAPTAAEVAAAIAAAPILLQRPVVVCGDRALIARPGDRVLELL